MDLSYPSSNIFIDNGNSIKCNFIYISLIYHWIFPIIIFKSSLTYKVVIF